MRVSHLFGDTRRDAPAEEQIPSQQMLVRAGYVDKLATGIFSYLPLAWRSLRKVEQILREEIDAIGGQELNMPVVHPAEIWQRTGRWDEIDESMVRFKDRRGHDMALAMTHEEVVGALAASFVKSYRQLPMLVYQIQTKFRDEARARGGLIRVREFVMKDSYSLDVDEAGLKRQYSRHYQAYHRIGRRVCLPLVAVGSDVGMMGGKQAHEFMYLTPIGEDTLAISESGDYAANQEAAVFQRKPFDGGEPESMKEVETPNVTTIADLAAFLAISPCQTAKAVFQMGSLVGGKEMLVIALIRGDMEVNLIKLRNLAGVLNLRPADREEILAGGAVPGYGSAIGVDRSLAIVVADTSVAGQSNLVAGANREGWHLTGTNYGRDYEADRVGDIAEAQEGDLSVVSGDPLHLKRGVEVGNIFQLGTKYTEANKATYTDENGEARPIVMGSYGIGVGRLFACVVEEHLDDKGLCIPISIAPYHVSLVSLCRQTERPEALYRELVDAGIEVLYDDREASAGVKFADSELRGLPIQVVISERSLKGGNVEVIFRKDGRREFVPVEEAAATLKRFIAEQFGEIERSLVDVPTWDG
ncbi:MAG: proline--tRNA ligase [Fimbriimonas sp.]|nr:proline--tRNA ligase [Fimbriimonas sp.]